MASKRFPIPVALALALWGLPHETLSADPTETSISELALQTNADGQWLLDFDYVFGGEPGSAMLRIEVPLEVAKNAPVLHSFLTRVIGPKTGAHHVSTAITYPGHGTSEQIIVTIVAARPDAAVLARSSIDQVIEWPTQDEKDFDTANSQIENGSREMLRQARATLERLIGKDPRFDPGYVELARVAMKTNWGPEGLHQAETLLDSALTIRPDSVNAKILMGYVYAHQHRYREAKAHFVDAAKDDPPNLWLWTNWGELLEMQDEPEQAIAKYREAVTRPMGPSRYFPARKDAYTRLLRMLEARNDADGLEALHQQRISEFGPSGCYSADYARFKLNVRGDAQSAIDFARSALSLNCETQTRQVLGLASYAKWAQGKGAESVEALHQARVFLPAGPMTLYLLASSDSTMPAAKKLLKDGEDIDQKDNGEMTALALALQMEKLGAAERLLRLGADPETVVTPAALPAALLPVVAGNVAAVRVMQRAGVDYSKLRYRGATALDFAEQTENEELIEALAPKGRAL